MAGKTGKEKRAARSVSCINTEEDYILWKKRKGRLAKERSFKVWQEEECAWEAKMAEGKEQWAILGEYFGDSPGTRRRKEIIDMSLDDTEKKLVESSWRSQPEDESPITKEKLLAGIEEQCRQWTQTLKGELSGKGPRQCR